MFAHIRNESCLTLDQVLSSMYQFYDADFRVRIHVFNAFLRKLASLEGGQKRNPILQNLFLQCALCYEIGFGVARDPSKSQELISKCEEYDLINFARELELVKANTYGWGLYDRVSTNYRKMYLATTGNGAPKNSLSVSYIRQRNIEYIELQYRKEIIDVENGLGANHPFVFALKRELRDILIQRGQQSEAEKIKAQIKDRYMRLSQYDPSRTPGDKYNLDAMTSLSKYAGRAREAEEVCQRALSSVSDLYGISDPATTEILWALSTIMVNQERLEEAELYLTQAIETSVKALGLTHPDNIARVTDLAVIYAKQDKLEEAETLVARSTEASLKILGEEHQISISCVSYLVSIRGLQQHQRPPRQRQWTTIEAQQTEVVKKFIGLYGRDHRRTIDSMSNLAVIWSEQRLWRIGATLFRHTIKESEKVFGKEDPVTLNCMAELANAYNWKMKRKESLALITGKSQTCDGTLHRKVLELSTKILGWDHPRTLSRANSLIWILGDQRQYKEVEILQLKILETMVRLQGEKHPNALSSMRILAGAIRKQGRLREAIELMNKGLQGISLLNRLYWRLLLSLGLFYT